MTLWPSTTLTGTVTANGKPISDVTIGVHSSGPTKLVRRNGFFVGQSTYYQLGTTTTNEKGEYSINVLDKVKGGQPGRYTVWVRGGIPNPSATNSGQAPSYANGKYSHDVEFFHGKGVISGTVVDTDDKPVAMVSVFVRRSMPLPNADIEPSRYFYPSKVTTDEQGKFKLEGLPAEGELLIGTAPSYVLGSPDLKRSDYTIDQRIRPGDENVRIKLPLKR